MARRKPRYSNNPSVHIDDYGNLHLNIFLHFFFEQNLPKYQKPDNEMTVEEKDMDSIKIVSNDIQAQNSVSHSSRITSSDWGYNQAILRSIQDSQKKSLKWYHRLRIWFEDVFFRSVPAEEIFTQAKQNFHLPTTEDLEKARDSAKKLCEYLRQSGQISQAKKVDTYSEILSGEIVLMKNGIDKYLIEDDIIDFMLKSERGVYIDFLRNFSNILPLDVAQKKIEIDKLLIFDNYAVMYYDPTIDPFRKLKDEDTKRKTADPILFGMISGSNKLYYVTDWVYKDDDLTMEKVEKAIGRQSRSLQNAKIAQTDFEVHQMLQDFNVDVIRTIEQAHNVST